MNEAAQEPASGDFRFLLGCMLGSQMLGTMATTTLPAVAPEVTASFGISSALIGYQFSLMAASMMCAFLFGGNFSARWGACRVNQAGLALVALSCIVATGPHVAFFFLSAIGLGLGYGMLTPSSSHLLMRFVPAERRNLLFSVKHSGVPLGGAAAALIAPAVATAFGWRWSLAVNVVLICVLIALLQRRRAEWDDDRQPAPTATFNPFEGVLLVWRHRGLRLLAIAGACLVVPQTCISTFTVVLFAEEMGYTLVAAGLVLTASQVAGAVGRIFWGWLADVTRDCYWVLAVLAAVMVAAALVCLAITPAWPIALAVVLFLVYGFTATGWNGAYLAQIARIAPAHEVSRATGGTLFFTCIGTLLGPVLMANTYAVAGSYSAAFGFLCIPTAAGLACLLIARSRSLAAVRQQRRV
jgi:MFS family permease